MGTKRKSKIPRAKRRPVPAITQHWIHEVDGIRAFLHALDQRDLSRDPHWVTESAVYYRERVQHLLDTPPPGVEVVGERYMVMGDLWDIAHCEHSA